MTAVVAVAATVGVAAVFLAPSGGAPSQQAASGNAPSGGASTSEAPTSEPPISEAPPADDSDHWCAEERDGATVVGNGPGGTTNGADAILAFDYAYYVERSGAKARAIAAPDARMGSAETIQGGIDSLPEGTEHCLSITETEPGRYSVTLSELRPDGFTQTYRQVVTTADVDGRTYITSIGASN